MNVIDRLYTEWAWRTKSGTPDFNNVEDKAILDHLIKELSDADGEISKKEMPISFCLQYTAAKKLFLLVSSVSSLYETPGVTSSVTPRFTIPFESLGSSS